MFGRGLIAAFLVIALAAPAAAQEKHPPYWASIASGLAMMRTGPARVYPGTWLYQRRDLPVLVLKRYQNWRLIRDPSGTQGWMLSTLLSDRRTAIVRPGDPRPMYSGTGPADQVRYRAEPGVVGRIDKCRDGWCRFTVGQRQGYISTADIWGVGRHEVLD
ncbi:MAG TPA: SH3 domain-containing protein [Sphingomicrobium sp.]|jgi:SH3-like domain-containing protein|nr:SH3 domain-containing protein [Sphingomicrobium sp.]